MSIAEAAALGKRATDGRRTNQANGAWSGDRSCCVGAHLARALGVARGVAHDYRVGVDTWAGTFGGNRAHAILLLRQAGAGHDPFSRNPWPEPPSRVWDRLAQVDALPTLVGADLSWVSLHGAGLRDEDLSGTDLTGADLYDAQMAGATLAGANLTGANLTYANLLVADLSGAILRGAWVTYATIDGADLTGVDWPRAEPASGRVQDPYYQAATRIRCKEATGA